MKVVIAIDSFKGSMSSLEAGRAAELGVRDIYPDAEVAVCPVADGGEGTTEAIVSGVGGEYRRVRVSDPLGRIIEAEYGVLPSGTAVIEMSRAAGITLVSENERDPLASDTFGVGEMILDALRLGVRDFIIGIGGSATNDGGVGMLRALGFGFFDKDGMPIPRGAAGLSELAKIDLSGADPRLSECSFRVASDVKNPLVGPMGATYVYGPQKGVGADRLSLLDGYLERYADLTAELIPSADKSAPGGGAAGGLGFALVSFLGAKLQSGVDLVTELIGLRDSLCGADLCITGEGRMDAQSAMGKLPVGVARLAKEAGASVVALAGSVADGAEALHAIGIDAAFSILRSPTSLAEAMRSDVAQGNMRAAAREIVSLFGAIKRGKERK